jgi:hypothetical protein
VQKSIIPALQPLYLAEQYKVLKKERLKNIAHFFGQKKMSLITVPYPF